MDFPRFYEILRVTLKNQEMNLILTAPITRIGHNLNTITISDVPIPSINVHITTQEISLEWKPLFTAIQKEEDTIKTKKMAQTIRTPCMPQLPERWQDDKAYISSRYE